MAPSPFPKNKNRCVFVPVHVGIGLFHCPSLPHISTELPISTLSGLSQLKVRTWSGGMGPLFRGKPLILSPPCEGGCSHLIVVAKNKSLTL